jgi:hypothetical protein
LRIRVLSRFRVAFLFFILVQPSSFLHLGPVHILISCVSCACPDYDVGATHTEHKRTRSQALRWIFGDLESRARMCVAVQGGASCASHVYLDITADTEHGRVVQCVSDRDATEYVVDKSVCKLQLQFTRPVNTVTNCHALHTTVLPRQCLHYPIHWAMPMPSPRLLVASTHASALLMLLAQLSPFV